MPYRHYINAADRTGLVILQEPQEERIFLTMSGESGAGIDAVGCEGTAAGSMAVWMLVAGH